MPKAYLSSDTPRAERGEDRTPVAQLRAMAEAIAISNDAEPCPRRALDAHHFTPCDGYRYMSEVWISGRNEGNAHAALAEAIDAFEREPLIWEEVLR